MFLNVSLQSGPLVADVVNTPSLASANCSDFSSSFSSRPHQHLRVLPPSAARLPQSHRSSEWGCRRHVPAPARRLQTQDQRWHSLSFIACRN